MRRRDGASIFDVCPKFLMFVFLGERGSRQPRADTLADASAQAARAEGAAPDSLWRDGALSDPEGGALGCNPTIKSNDPR